MCTVGFCSVQIHVEEQVLGTQAPHLLSAQHTIKFQIKDAAESVSLKRKSGLLRERTPAGCNAQVPVNILWTMAAS